MKIVKGSFWAIALCALAVVGTLSCVAETYNLNVDWRFAKIGNNIYGLPSALEKAAKGGAQVYDVAYDDAAWELVSTPHAVNAHDTYNGHATDAGEADYWRGWMAYRKTIKIPEGKHFFLEFDTVRQSLYVYANGKLAGYYEAGTSPTAYDITPFVTPGKEALITVVTENTASRGSKCVSSESKDVPGDWKGEGFQWAGSDFNPVQGGLIGNVMLNVKKSDTYITLPYLNTLKTTGVYIWADEFDFAAGAATIHVEAEVKAGEKVEVKGQGRGDGVWFELDGKRYEGGKARVKGLTFWSPDVPYLYDVKVGYKDLDEVTIRTGFRKVEFKKGKRLLINDKEVWLPGYAQRATDSWAAIGFAPAWLQDYDADLIRQSGGKFIRWMHITPKPAPVRAFDKYGVVNVVPAGDKEGESSGRHWEQRVEAMEAALVYFRNSPSVIFWEAGNNRISPEKMRQMRQLKEKYDPHGGRFMGCRTISSEAAVAEAEYVGTMIHRHDASALESMEKLGKSIPIMETEYCREEAPRRSWDRFSPPDFNFNCVRLASGAKKWMYNCYDMTQEDYALSNASTKDGYGYFYGNRSSGKIGGNYVAAAMLCWSDCNQHGRNSNTENCRSSGRVDAVRIPKENFYVHQVMYSETPKIKILGHWNYPKKTAENYWYREQVDDGQTIAYTGERKQRDPEHKTVYVMGSLQVDHIELFVNGVSKGVAKKPQQLFDFAFPNIDVTESGAITAIAYDRDNKEIARDEIRTVGAAAKLVMTAKTGPKGFLADGSDIAMVDLKLVDAAGLVLPLAANRIDFTLDGPAVFMGGWNSGTFDETSPVGKDWVNLEQGWARVFVKAGRTPGKVTLTAKVQGDGGLTAKVAFDTKPIVLKDGMMSEGPQAEPINTQDYTVKNPVPPVRDLTQSALAVGYKVRVNGQEVKFQKRSGGAFKPDESTGVVCPYVPLLQALTNAGAKVTFRYDPKKIQNKRLRKFSTSGVYAAWLQMKADGKTIDAIAGLTVLFEDNGKDKNLTNYEITAERGIMVGEMGPLLGYIPGIEVKTDEKSHVVDIMIK